MSRYRSNLIDAAVRDGMMASSGCILPWLLDNKDAIYCSRKAERFEPDRKMYVLRCAGPNSPARRLHTSMA